MNSSHDHASSRKIEEPVLALLVHGILTAMGRDDIILSSNGDLFRRKKGENERESW
jgi:hypothetical protein